MLVVPHIVGLWRDGKLKAWRLRRRYRNGRHWEAHPQATDDSLQSVRDEIQAYQAFVVNKYGPSDSAIQPAYENDDHDDAGAIVPDVQEMREE